MSNVDAIQLNNQKKVFSKAKDGLKKNINYISQNQECQKSDFNNLEANKDNIITELHTLSTKNNLIPTNNSNANKAKQDINQHSKHKSLHDSISPLQINESISKMVNQTLHETIQDHITYPNSQRLRAETIPTHTHKGRSQDKIREVKTLRKNEEEIKKNLYQLNQHLQILESESYLNIENSIIDSNIKATRLKHIKDQKTNLFNKLEQINAQIGDIMAQESLRDKNDKVKNYIKEFSTINTVYARKMHEFEHQSILSRQKRMNDLSQDKRRKELELQEQNMREQKEKLILNQKAKEKEITKKRKEIIDSHMEKTKKYLKEQYKKKQKDYLFYSNIEQYNLKEKKLIDKAKMIKKDHLVSKEEWMELSRQLKANQQHILKQGKEKTDLMKEMWKNRSQSLPSYESQLQKIVEYEKMKQIEEEERKKLSKIAHLEEGLNYAKEYISQPKPSPKLKRERENAIIRLTIKKKRSPKDDKLRIRKEEVYKPPNMHKKPKSVNIPNIEPVVQPKKAHDYLNDLKIERLEHNIPLRKYDWEKMLNNEKGTMTNNIEMVKLQTKSIDKLAYEQRDLMRINGGYSKRPELGNKIGNLLLASIKAKVMIMNKINSRVDN